MKFDAMPVATEKQIEEIEAVASLAWQECSAGLLYSEKQNTDLFDEMHSKESMKRLMQAGQIYYMLLADNQLAGYLAFRNNGTSIFLYILYIKPAFRRKGLGRKALEHFDKMLSGDEFRHIRKLTLRVPQSYPQVIHILKHLDFQITKTFDGQSDRGHPLNEYVMERKIKRNLAIDYGK